MISHVASFLLPILFTEKKKSMQKYDFLMGKYDVGMFVLCGYLHPPELHST